MADAAPRPTSYKFKAVARFPDGREEPFVAETAGSGFREGYGHYCEISCPTLKEDRTKIYGIDGEQTLELAVEFVRTRLSGEQIVLLDADGNEVELPEFGGISWKARHGGAGQWNPR